MLTRATFRSAVEPPPGVLAVPVPAPATVEPVATVVAVAEPLSAVTPDSVAAAADPVLTSGLNGSLTDPAASPEAVTEVEGPISWARVVVGTAPAVAGGAVGPSSVPPSSGRTTSTSCRGPPAVTCGWVAMDASPHLRARAGRGRRGRRGRRRAAGLRQLEHGQDDVSFKLVG